jgi:hypothetical protein
MMAITTSNSISVKALLLPGLDGSAGREFMFVGSITATLPQDQASQSESANWGATTTNLRHAPPEHAPAPGSGLRIRRHPRLGGQLVGHHRPFARRHSPNARYPSGGFATAAFTCRPSLIDPVASPTRCRPGSRSFSPPSTRRNAQTGCDT